MKKREAAIAALAVLVLYGVGFLVANHGRIPFPEPDRVPVSALSAAGPGGASGATGGEGAAAGPAPGLPAADPVHASSRYRNIRELGTLSPTEIARIYDLGALPTAGGRLVTNHKTRLIAEGLLDSLPREEILRGGQLIEAAVAIHDGPQVAAEFTRLIREYLKYKDAIAAIDADRNARGIVTADVQGDALLRQRLQDKAFGEQKAAALFWVERETYALMNRQKAELGSAAGNLGPEQLERLHAEYLAILAREPLR